MSLSIAVQQEIRAASQEAEAISLKPAGTVTPQDKQRFNFLMSQVSLLKSGALSDETRMASADALAEEFGFAKINRSEAISETRKASDAMRRIILYPETRTYSPMTTGTDGPVIPQQFEQRLVEMQMSAGPLYAGSPAISNIETSTNAPRKMPTTDDTASSGYVQTEAGAPTEAEFVLSQVSMGTTTFSSGLVQYSGELAQDVLSWAGLEQILLGSLSKRLGRIQNSTFLAALLTALGNNSTASVAAAGSSIVHDDVTNLVGSVNASYRYSDRAGFLMNTGSQKALGNLKTSDGLPIFKHILAAKPTLLDYPVYVSDYADPINTSGKNPILFGDWSYVYCRHIPGFEIQVLKERYIDQFSDAILARKRADLQYSVPSTSDSAIKMLHFS
jgi:HK97 family phage major capsid protein